MFGMYAVDGLLFSKSNFKSTSNCSHCSAKTDQNIMWATPFDPYSVYSEIQAGAVLTMWNIIHVTLVRRKKQSRKCNAPDLVVYLLLSSRTTILSVPIVQPAKLASKGLYLNHHLSRLCRWRLRQIQVAAVAFISSTDQTSRAVRTGQV